LVAYRSCPNRVSNTCAKESWIASFEHATTSDDRIVRALALAVQYGGIDGDHHKAWVIDQMVRILAGDGYDKLVAYAREGEDGPETYDWDVGIAP